MPYFRTTYLIKTQFRDCKFCSLVIASQNCSNLSNKTF